MRLRAAAENEFEAIRAFYWDLIDRMQDRNDTVGWKKGIYPTDGFLRESIEQGELFVLDRKDGYAGCVIVNSLRNDGYEGLPCGIDCEREDVLVPHALAVRPDLHGQGIGKSIVGDILELARKTGRKTVRLDILNGNTAAERLYTGMGFRFVQEKTMFYADTGWTRFSMYERILQPVEENARAGKNRSAEKIFSACGNDCAACPRYTEEPHAKSEAELLHTARIWFRIGYRDRIVTKEEIACKGCKADNPCRYRIASCAAAKSVQNCGQCAEFPCEKNRECFRVTKSFVPACRAVCTREEYEAIDRAFFHKEENLEAGRTGQR